MKKAVGFAVSAIICMLLAVTAHAEIMVVGIDRKFAYDQNAIRQALQAGHDEVMFFDLKNPAKPTLLGSVAMENSILGPPTNVAVTPDQSLALIANSVTSEKTAEGWKAVPTDELFVVDLHASPPRLLRTIKVGRQPSGIGISHDGSFALVANRNSKSISVLKIEDATVSVSDTIALEDAAGAIAITPDGRHAIATKTAAHKAMLLDISASHKVTIDRDLWVGLFPWNVTIAPDGSVALVNNIGNGAQSDGSANTVSVIDLAAKVPYVSEYVTVGDAPEGIAFSPRGNFAAVTLLQGSYDAPPSAWFKHEDGKATLLSVAKGKVRAVNSVEVGAFPEGIGFSANGQYVYVGNYHSNSISILKISNFGQLVDTQQTISLPGPPASLRIGSQ